VSDYSDDFADADAPVGEVPPPAAGGRAFGISIDDVAAEYVDAAVKAQIKKQIADVAVEAVSTVFTEEVIEELRARSIRSAEEALREQVEADAADQDRAAAAPAADAAEPPGELVFGSVDEFVREQLRVMYRRVVGERSPRRWAADWWNYPEAVSRLDALWRSWENARQDPVAMSAWWRDHLDHHMPILMSQDGPFATATASAAAGEMLPCDPPPPSMFPDQRLS